MPPEPSRVRRQLGSELALLRSRARLSMRDLGGRLGADTHARVQRIEKGTGAPPTVDELKVWLDATAADPDARDRIGALWDAAHGETVPWPDYVDATSGRHFNERARAMEHDAALNCSFQQQMVPGLAQTSAYARALLGHLAAPLSVEGHLAGLMARQELLHDPVHEFRFVITPRVLAWNPDPDSVPMAAQLDRLREIDRLPTSTVRVLADDASPMGGYSSFTLYDRPIEGAEPLVQVELEARWVPMTRDDEVERYRRRFAQLFDAATSISDLPR